LRRKSLQALEIIRRETRLPVISCGGVSDAASAGERLAAGADLLQIYTSFVYQGPAVLRKLLEQ
jgi:dihydroorotate dehydrogenase